MRNLALISFITFSLFASSFAQVPDSDVAEKAANNLVEKEKPLDEKEEFESAVTQSLASERIDALKKFLKDFPESERKTEALEAIVRSRAELADEKLRLSEIEEGISLFKLAVAEAPDTISDRFFSRILVKFPANLFFRGQREAGNDVAKLIEEKVSEDPKRLLGLATFYLSTENASEALRLARKAVELDPASAAANHTIGYAYRLNFDLDEAAAAFEKALEIDPASAVSKNSLAEMKRATGKPDQAAELYREILLADPSNAQAKTGLALSLFESNQQDEAEKVMSDALAENANNLALLVGASYWYAANGNGVKAVELAEQVLAFEPRYTWTYIAMARGFMQQNDPLSAERTLLAARRYGNFPTLEYELATTRAAAGFFKEAAEGLSNSFSIDEGKLKTKLGGRVERKADQFIELLSLERRASIFQSKAADSEENSRLLKSLLEFSKNLDAEELAEGMVESSADEFISGDDNMKFHRQMYAANQLLEKNKALPKVLEITKSAVSGVDAGLNVASPSAAVLADQLYESRKIAVARGRTVIVPEIPRQTLLKIMRGKIEEVSGWAHFQQEEPEEAKSRLKLATSVLPQDSVWSRSTSWKLGTILESEGKPKEALDAYIKGYFAGEQSTGKKIVLETLYARIHGSLEGLDERLKKKASDQDSVSIFTNKPKKKQEVETVPENNSENDNSQEGAKEGVKTTIDAAKVPSRVPIAESTPAKKPIEKPQEKVADPRLEKDDTNAEVKTENLEKTDPVTSVDTKTVDKSVESKDGVETESDILRPNSNIDKLTDIPLGEAKKKPLDKRAESESDASKETAIFDPIVIKIPDVTKATLNPKTDGVTKKEPTSEGDSEVESKTKPDEDKLKTESDKPDAPKPGVDETKKTVEGDEKENEKPDEKIESGLERPRVVSEDVLDAAKNAQPEIKPCKLILSQDVVTIINDGGSLGVLVALEGSDSDPRIIKAVSSSPEDIEVVLEPDIGPLSGRAFFIIKSISSIQGLFSVTFNAPCGTKEIPVKVR